MNKKVINSGEIIVNALYLIMMKANTNWCWEEHGNKDSFIIANHNIVHPNLGVAIIKYV